MEKKKDNKIGIFELKELILIVIIWIFSKDFIFKGLGVGLLFSFVTAIVIYLIMLFFGQLSDSKPFLILFVLVIEVISSLVITAIVGIIRWKMS